MLVCVRKRENEIFCMALRESQIYLKNIEGSVYLSVSVGLT